MKVIILSLSSTCFLLIIFKFKLSTVHDSDILEKNFLPERTAQLKRFHKIFVMPLTIFMILGDPNNLCIGDREKN